jgi:hypothetical protein
MDILTGKIEIVRIFRNHFFNEPFEIVCLNSYISGMEQHAPTYTLGPNFDQKLTSFTQALLTAGWEVFEKEFANIDTFVEMAKKDCRKRDDHTLRRTEKSIYLLEAVSIKIYDTVNREAFNHTEDTIIIIPDCLSLHNPNCIKEDHRYGDICRQCTTDCQANEICELAERYQAKVIFSKRKLEQQLQHYVKKSKNPGIIGIACLLMLASGMRKVIGENIPVRGVPLGITGCEHWNDAPFASSFPMKQLSAILEEKYGHKH